MTIQEYYVDTPQQLVDICGRLRGSAWLALDTEFIREKTYYTQLCLLQIANESVIACIDPLTLQDLGPLFDLLYDPATVKIMHSARQDLEILYDFRGDLPYPLFDTQIAATLLGHGEQIGYGALVQSLLGIHLDKSHTRTDWSRRPLDLEQVRYAADDVRYLGQIYTLQWAELEHKGRLGWLNDDFAGLTDIHKYLNSPLSAWRRIKLAHTLHGAQLAALRALAAWREERARMINKPRKWILGDDVLIDLARHLPGDMEKLGRIRDLDSHTLKKLGTELLAIIHDAKALPREEWPRLEPPLRLDTRQEALVDALMAVVRLRGLQNAVSPATLATRKELEQLVLGAHDVPLLHGWRAALVGKDLQGLLQGRLSLSVRDGDLSISSI